VIGTVLYQDLLLGGRRRRLHLLRWICGGILWAQFAYLYTAGQMAFWRPGDQPGAGLVLASHAHVRLLAWEQFLLVLVVTPAFVAGELTDAKTSGSLQHLLTTQLRSWEIVLGKLAAQGVILAALLALTFPLLCFSAAGIGMPLVPLVAQVLGMVLLVFLLGAAGLLASVWCRNTSDAILSVYGTILGLLLLAWGLQAALTGQTGLAGAVGGAVERVLAVFDPGYLMEPAWADAGPAVAWRRLLAVALIWGGGGVVCLALACWRLRPAYARQLEAAGRRKGVAAGRPPVGDEPVRWREEHVEGVAPLAALRQVPRWLGVTLVSLVTVLVLGLLYAQEAAGPPSTGMAKYLFHLKVGLVVAFAGLLVVGVRSSSAVTREREARTWEALLLSPTVTRKVIEEKFRGILGAARPYLLAYAVPALVLALIHGFATMPLPASGRWRLNHTPVFGFADFLLAALWLISAYFLMHWVAAAGLACSAGASSSWRSLLLTFGMSGYLGLVMCLLPSLLLGVAIAVSLDSMPHSEVALCACFPGLASCGFFWLARTAARGSLVEAETAILKAERTWTIPEGLLHENQRPGGARRGEWGW
jgi:ABC-type transport system involved in multi-copper enzyme maturation permease subunit